MSPKVFDQAGWLSGSTRVIGATGPGDPPPPPPPSGGIRTFIGSWALPTADWGGSVTPDAIIVNSSGTSLAQTGGLLDDAAAAGGGRTPPCCLFIRITANDQTMEADGSISTALWKTKFDAWKNGIQGVSGGETKLRTAVATGAFRALVALDDFQGGGGSNGFSTGVTYEEIEDICNHVKVVRGWNWLPIVLRGANSYMRSRAVQGSIVRQYQWLDAGWMQIRLDQNGNVGAYINTHWAAGEECGLAGVGGANLLNGGEGLDPAWRFHPNNPNLTAMSPTEIRTTGAAFLADPRVHGHSWWTAGLNSAGADAYWHKPEIMAAMTDVNNSAIGRTEGPINIRGDLAAP